MLPRPTLIGTLFLLITVACILLLQPFAATLHDYSSTLFRPGPSLSTRLADEESRYAAFLQKRMEFIKKLAPNAEDIDP